MLTAANWASAPLQDVIRTALLPYRTGENRFTVSGPPLVVKSRQALALSLAIHELATNALKYGAMTVASGQVSIVWTCESQDGQPELVFVWQEIRWPTCVATRPYRLWFAAHFPGFTRRFRRLRFGVLRGNGTRLPPDGPARKFGNFRGIPSQSVFARVSCRWRGWRAGGPNRGSSVFAVSVGAEVNRGSS